MSAGILEEIVAGRLAGIPRMNVEEFEQYMNRILVNRSMRCELLDGYPVIRDSAATGDDPMIMGVRHALVVNALSRRLTVYLYGSGLSSNCQTPIALDQSNVVEPDLTIIRGRDADYLPGYPDPVAIVMIIEVSDSSVEADRVTKLEKYARAGVPTYWIVNLRQLQIEIYDSPVREHGSYLNSSIHQAHETVELSVADLAVQALSVQSILDGTI